VDENCYFVRGKLILRKEKTIYKVYNFTNINIMGHKMRINNDSLIKFHPHIIFIYKLFTYLQKKDMCIKITCKKCGKATWSGCGSHISIVLAGVKEENRCKCRETKQVNKNQFNNNRFNNQSNSQSNKNQYNSQNGSCTGTKCKPEKRGGWNNGNGGNSGNRK
jgi:hypothetical protein